MMRSRAARRAGSSDARTATASAAAAQPGFVAGRPMNATQWPKSVKLSGVEARSAAESGLPGWPPTSAGATGSGEAQSRYIRLAAWWYVVSRSMTTT